MDEQLLNRLMNRRQRSPLQKIGNAVGEAMYIVGSGKLPPKKDETSDLDMYLKMNQLQTGSPEFQREQAQTKANINFKSEMEQWEVKRKMEEKIKAEELRQKRIAKLGYDPETQSGPGAPPAVDVQPQPANVQQPNSIQPKDLAGIPGYDSITGKTDWDAIQAPPQAPSQTLSKPLTPVPPAVVQTQQYPTRKSAPAGVIGGVDRSATPDGGPSLIGSPNIAEEKAPYRRPTAPEPPVRYTQAPPTISWDDEIQYHVKEAGDISVDPRFTSEVAARAGANAEQEKNRLKASQSFNKVAGLFQGMVAQFKAKKAQQGGQSGLIPGLKGRVRTFFKDPSASSIAAFPGQRIETAAALNSIITGQNRVIRDVLNLILTTLPDELDPDTYAADKIAQSLFNTLELTRAVMGAGLKDKFDLNVREVEQKFGIKIDPGNKEFPFGDNVEANEYLSDLDSNSFAPYKGYLSERMLLATSNKQREEFEPFIQIVLNTPAMKNFQFDQYGEGVNTTSSGNEFKREG